MWAILLTVTILIASHQVFGASSSFLSVHGNHFQLNGERVFLSGANQAWVSYGYDFGNRNYQWRGKDLERYLKELHEAGGNSLRIWIHIEGAVTPNFDGNGYVTAPDKEGTFLNEMKTYLKKAQEYNILVFFCLWNGAVAQGDHYKLDGLIKDPKKLQSYIDKALIPWVNTVKHFPSLGGWDIMNEPEGEIIPDLQNSEPCYRTTSLHNSGAGWAGRKYTAQEYLRFINWQADAIHRADPKSLVSVGSWNVQSNTDAMGKVDFYKDSCLLKAGGRAKGTMDFVQTHSYAWQGSYDSYSPFKHVASDYHQTKPIVIGEFNQVSGGGMDIVDQFAWAYNKGYSGAWTCMRVRTAQTQTPGPISNEESDQLRTRMTSPKVDESISPCKINLLCFALIAKIT
ncbi:mannan endo-1,4-beta-mannosidase-like [Liolophura sinensis]|uniref:mannan endo-1,4-beta-mannosidase-like n=1 Tax=Liolophura sinensis TaxID=3198878 RepID=UPI0031597CE3